MSRFIDSSPVSSYIVFYMLSLCCSIASIASRIAHICLFWLHCLPCCSVSSYIAYLSNCLFFHFNLSLSLVLNFFFLHHSLSSPSFSPSDLILASLSSTTFPKREANSGNLFWKSLCLLLYLLENIICTFSLSLSLSLSLYLPLTNALLPLSLSLFVCFLQMFLSHTQSHTCKLSLLLINSVTR